MYPNLYKGLGLKSEDLAKYDTPLVGFDRKMVIPMGQIKLHIITKGKDVMVNFIVVHIFSPCTEILAWLWIHAMGAVMSTLHLKVKFLTKQGIIMVRRDQNVARQCLIVAITHEGKQKEQIELAPLQQLQGPNHYTGLTALKSWIKSTFSSNLTDISKQVRAFKQEMEWSFCKYWFRIQTFLYGVHTRSQEQT